jgi:hypothetical protein
VRFAVEIERSGGESVRLVDMPLMHPFGAPVGSTKHTYVFEHTTPQVSLHKPG